MYFCYWTNFSMKGDEGDFLSDAPNWKRLFLLKIKIIMWSWNYFIRKSELISEVKKTLNWSMIGETFHIEKDLSKLRRWRKSLVLSRYSWWLWGELQRQEYYFTLRWSQYEIKGISKFQISQLFSKMGKTWNWNVGL